ncbi:MAG: hypothetical protein F4139_10350 [Gemmatimonadetes bacterium]|nr:hypothetical protein [Gemmatimonadota bacterium]MYA64951.1 hypothetical protein [Gemmatimonadota bacterium]MYB98123.1 hypothetical protein [Gemmatimonadota bacterium]MYH53336.1 hypothetical protein [Gemmatimonadota bacterium]MYI45944.1 hypothetical protein [Gemmatimonadota bacterium]
MAISLAITAAESGRRVYYGTRPTRSRRPQAAGRFNQRLKTLTHPALLVVDEIGYLPVTLFFQLVNRRNEHASTVLTSNQGLEHWDETLHEERPGRWMPKEFGREANRGASPRVISQSDPPYSARSASR